MLDRGCIVALSIWARVIVYGLIPDAFSLYGMVVGLRVRWTT